MTKVLCISDTHGKHSQIPQEWLEEADIIIHAGDISNVGGLSEIEYFCEWFSSLSQYKHKIFIAGNHDFGFENKSIEANEIVKKYPNITYLQDSSVTVEGLKIYGSPWQPEFYDWAFNLPRNGEQIESKWNAIDKDTDILITHGPAWGTLDTTPGNLRVGCEILTEKIANSKIRTHICGHIHHSYGEMIRDWTHYINAATLNERYEVQNPPIIFEI
jgi:Icc-related predicted phosphoesterase